LSRIYNIVVIACNCKTWTQLLIVVKDFGQI